MAYSEPIVKKVLRRKFFTANFNEAPNRIDVASFGEFLESIAEYNPPIVFNGNNGVFYFIHDGHTLTFRTNKFTSIEDYMDASTNGFKDASHFKQARDRGFQTRQEYDQANQGGWRDRAHFDKGEKLGFVGAISKLDQSQASLFARGNQKEGRLYDEAVKLGYRDFSEFLEGKKGNYRDASEYREAKEGNFPNISTFRKAKGQGFTNYVDFKYAQKAGLVSMAEFEKYQVLKELVELHKFLGFDEAYVYNEIAGLPIGGKIPVSKIFPLEENEAGFRFPENRLSSMDLIRKFLQTHVAITALGKYDHEGDFFLRGEGGPAVAPEPPKKISDRFILIDASNVAWGDRGEDGPILENLVAVIGALKDNGYEQVEAIADASLRHKIDNRDGFEKMEKDGLVHQAPAGTEADDFFIQYAKKNHALIVTNDKLQDWKDKDAWVAANIDELRVPFMIVKGQVTFQHAALK